MLLAPDSAALAFLAAFAFGIAEGLRFTSQVICAFGWGPRLSTSEYHTHIHARSRLKMKSLQGGRDGETLIT